MGKGRNGVSGLHSLRAIFLPLIDNALTQGKMKCWKADSGGGVQSSGGSQTSLTSLPFFFCQVFIKRKCTDIKNPGLKGTFFLHQLASRTLSVSLKSLTSSLSWSKLLWDCPLGYREATNMNKFKGGSSKGCWETRLGPLKLPWPLLWQKPKTPAASYRKAITFLLALHVNATKSASPKHLLYYEELKGHFIIQNMKK